MTIVMLHAFLFSVVLLSFSPSKCETVDSPSLELNETQVEAVKSAMRLMLRIEDIPETNGKGALEKAYKIPKHILELSEKIDSGENIRCIGPIKDFVPHIKDLLVYNLSAVARSEKMKTAQLHIFRRRLLPQKGHSRKRLLPPPCRVRLYQLMTSPGPSTQPAPTGYPVDEDTKELTEIEKMKLRSLDSIPVAQGTKGGWYTIDISMALKEMLNSIGATNNFVFGVRFEGPRGKPITPQHFLKDPDVNSSSSFVVVFSDESNSKELSLENVRLSMGSDQIAIMSELLETAAISNTKKPQSPTIKTKIDAVPYLPDKNKHMKRKTKKVESSDDELYNVESIRHARKYYGNLVKASDDENNKLYNEKANKKHRFSKATPGNGDISELFDFERIRKAKALRRHNHKTINSLNLRYDTATRSIVQKKVDKPDYEGEDERNSSANWTRKTRSIHDNELTDYVIEFAENEEPTTQSPDYVDKINKVEEEVPEKESEREDDMGDLSYYEPDVYLHENLVPESYRHRYHKHIRTDDRRYEDIDTNMALADEDDEYKYNKDVDQYYKEKSKKMKQKDERRRHKNQKRKSKKNKEAKNSRNDWAECHLSHFSVDISSLGWEDWIIGPKTFQTAFCSGRCSMYDRRNSTMKNHAVVQSIVHLLNSNIPEPCCVPSKTKSMSLTILDEYGTIYLKNIKDMIVESCECA